jgi:hypothetical protein
MTMLAPIHMVKAERCFDQYFHDAVLIACPIQ